MNTSILIIEDDELLATTFQRFLKGAGYRVDHAGDYEGGRELLLSGSYSAVFMDINLQGSKTGIDLLKEVRDINLAIPVVIITGAPDVATAAASVRNAAFDYLCKPVEKEQLLEVAQAAVSHKAQQDEREQQHRNLENTLNNIRSAVVAADFNRPIVSQADNQNGLLSDREKQILSMLGQGESTTDIAAHFALSVRTVESYCARIVDKFGLDGMKALRRYAIQQKKQG
jgi:FixJ family two-component response regulator